MTKLKAVLFRGKKTAFSRASPFIFGCLSYIMALENLFIHFAQLKIPQPCLKHWAQKIGTQKTVSVPALLPEEAFGT